MKISRRDTIKMAGMAAAAAVTGTMAIALKLMGRADSIDEAQAQALAMWEARDKANPGVAA